MGLFASLDREIRRNFRPLQDLPRYRIARCEPGWLEPPAPQPPAQEGAVLVTCGFGHERYRQAARRLARQARATGFFAEVFAFTALAEVPGLDAADRTQVEALAALYPRGFGLWAWKPVVLFALMKTLPPGTSVFYVDAGCELSAWGAPRLAAYAEELRRHGNLFFSIPYPERRWTKRSVLERFGLPVDDASDQVQATWFAVANVSPWREFVQQWAGDCLADNARSLRPPSEAEEAGLLGHREDQSVLSCLLKCRKDARIMRWEDHFMPELYRPDSWILLMPVHTLRRAGEASLLEPLLQASDPAACARNARAVPSPVDPRRAVRFLRELMYAVRGAFRSAWAQLRRGRESMQ